MSKKIYIGNLPFKTSEKQVAKLVEELGEIESITMVRDRKRKRFKGFCFVVISDDEKADAAIAALNGKLFNGKELQVNEAESREEAAGGWRAAVVDNRIKKGESKNHKRAAKRKGRTPVGGSRRLAAH